MSKLQRNDVCPCGSGKKYKKCHQNEYEDKATLFAHASDYPLEQVLVAGNFEEMGLTPVIIIRASPLKNRFLMAIFLCDLFCLGLKNVIAEVNLTQSELDFFIEAQPQDMVSVDYEIARELVFGSIAYADSLGFKPHFEWEETKSFIEPERPYPKNRKFGYEGKPFYVLGPDDNEEEVIATLTKVIGKNGFEFMDPRDEF